LYTSTGSVDPEGLHRISRARVVTARIGPRVLYKPKFDLGLRVELYKCLVLPVLLYNLHTRAIPMWLLQRLEQFQMRVLRGITGEGRRTDRRTNIQIREELGVESIQSILRRRRLQFWHDVLCKQQAGKGVRAAAFGTLLFFDKQLEFPVDDQPLQYRQLKHDVVAMVIAGGAWIDNGVWLTTSDLRLLKQSERQDIDRLSSFVTEAEQDRAIKDSKQQRKADLLQVEGNAVCCPICGDLQVRSSLGGHMNRAHGWERWVASLMKGAQCPACNMKFHRHGRENRDGAMVHFRERCALGRVYIWEKWQQQQQHRSQGLRRVSAQNRQLCFEPTQSQQQGQTADGISPFDLWVKKGE